MYPVFAIITVTLLASFLACWLLVPFIAERLRKRGICGGDMNKLGRPKVPEMGGIAVLFGFAFSAMFALAICGFGGTPEMNLTALLAAFSTIVLVGAIGIVDDLIGWRNGIKQWQHAIAPLFAALPLMVLPQSIGFTDMTIPFMGMVVSFGIYYAIFIVPIAITGASNAVNMLAGFNGLEAGMGALIMATLLATAASLPFDHAGKLEAIIITSAMLGALLAFLRYNWFPAKVFGGDSLTLMIGASAAAVAIIGNMEKIALLLFALYFIELVFKAKHGFKSECYGIPQKDGTLKADPRGGSLTHWVMRRGKFTEPQVVAILLGMQALVCAAVFSLSWFKLFKLI
ncbi:MAG: glycosyltransferase 4 family protein [Candidatus Diapherotrites archaeon]